MDNPFISHLHHQNLIVLSCARTSFLFIFSILLLLIIFSISKKQHEKAINVNADHCVFDSTETLRGLAILLLVLGHFSQQCTEGVLPFRITGNAAVITFLFVSGIALTKTYGLTNIGKHFFKKRFKKIMGHYWITLGLFFTLNFILIHESPSVKRVILNFAGIIWPGLPNSPAWFITYISYLYIIYYIASLLNVDNFYKLIIIFLLSYCSIFWITYCTLKEYFEIWMQYSLVFPSGVFIGLYREKIFSYLQVSYRSFPLIYLILLLVFLCHYYDGTGIYRVSHIIPSYIFVQTVSATINPFSLLIVLTLLIYLLDTLNFKSKFLIFLGGYSFELYLLHFPFMVNYDFFLSRKPFATFFLIYLFFMILLSCILKKISYLLSRIAFQRLEA